jgi:hypothetical protein
MPEQKVGAVDGDKLKKHLQDYQDGHYPTPYSHEYILRLLESGDFSLPPDEKWENMPLTREELVRIKEIVKHDDRCFIRYGEGSENWPSMSRKWLPLLIAEVERLQALLSANKI